MNRLEMSIVLCGILYTGIYQQHKPDLFLNFVFNSGILCARIPGRFLSAYLFFSWAFYVAPSYLVRSPTGKQTELWNQRFLCLKYPSSFQEY